MRPFNTLYRRARDISRLTYMRHKIATQCSNVQCFIEAAQILRTDKRTRVSHQRKFARGNPRRDLPDLLFTTDPSASGRKQNVQVGIKLRLASGDYTRRKSLMVTRELRVSYFRRQLISSIDRARACCEPKAESRLKMPRS